MGWCACPPVCVVHELAWASRGGTTMLAMLRAHRLSCCCRGCKEPLPTSALAFLHFLRRAGCTDAPNLLRCPKNKIVMQKDFWHQRVVTLPAKDIKQVPVYLSALLVKEELKGCMMCERERAPSPHDDRAARLQLGLARCSVHLCDARTGCCRPRTRYANTLAYGLRGSVLQETGWTRCASGRAGH